MSNTELKLRRVRRLDSIRLDTDDKTYFTEEGYLIDHPILTSCGIFEYTNPDGSIRRELRLPENVFDEKSLKTYKGKPIIITHDAGEVDKNNVYDEQIGTILSDGYQDGEDVRAEIIIHDTDAMNTSRLRELSLGYNLDLIEKPGNWNGEPYDAIQTNIVINHLALVASARAGEQARLNIDGSDEPELKGGKVMSQNRNDGALTPEELEEAIAAYKAKKMALDGADDDSASEPTPAKAEDAIDGGVMPPVKPTEESVPAPTVGKTPMDIANEVKARKDANANCNPADLNEANGIIARQDADIDMLLAALEKFFMEEKAEGNHDGDDDTDNADCGDNTDNSDNADNADNADGDDDKDEEDDEEIKEDSSDDDSKSLNADSADDIIKQRLSICRVGDKLNLDGLENMSIIEGKKTIIKKAIPSMRLDGKSKAYIDAAYDMAVNEISKPKNVSYQRMQMSGNGNMPMRNDGTDDVPMAMSARQRMIEREGGNE